MLFGEMPGQLPELTQAPLTNCGSLLYLLLHYAVERLTYLRFVPGQR